MSMESNKDTKGYPEETTEEQEEFSFLQEKIKKKPITWRMVANQFVKMVICGIVFGVMASISFFMLKPWAEAKFQKNPSKVTIPKDDEKDPEGEEQPPEVVLTPPELTLDSYARLNAQLYDVVREADKSIVEVRGIHGNEGWVRETYDTVNSVSGAIVADTGVEFLVLVNNSILNDTEGFTVTFNDENTYQAKLKKQDKNLGIAILGVAKKDLKSNSSNQIKVAVLGNSNQVKRGDTLIALGKPFGYSEALGYGVASSVRKKISLADGDYKLLLSDIPGNRKGSGFLINLRGEIVGVIQPQLTDGENLCVSNALAISSLKEAIELLSNGNSVPYLGIMGAEITEQIAGEQGIPRGVYVKNVESDSPAMEAGIQSGDIITNIEKTEIVTLDGYQDKILEYKAGETIRLNGKRRGNDGYVDIQFTVIIGSRE